MRHEDREQHAGSAWILHAPGHWRVALVDKLRRTVSFFDPYGVQLEGDMVRAFRGAYRGYEMVPVRVKVQSDGCNCGIWVAWCISHFAEYVLSTSGGDFPSFLRARMRGGDTQGVTELPSTRCGEPHARMDRPTEKEAANEGYCRAIRQRARVELTGSSGGRVDTSESTKHGEQSKKRSVPLGADDKLNTRIKQPKNGTPPKRTSAKTRKATKILTGKK